MIVVFRDWKPLKPHPSKHGFTKAAVHLVTSCVKAHVYLSSRYSADRISDVPRVKTQPKFLEGLRECSPSSAAITPGRSMTIYNGGCGFTPLQIVMQLAAVGEKTATLKHGILPIGHETGWFVSGCEVEASGSQQWFQGVFLALSPPVFLSHITYKLHILAWNTEASLFWKKIQLKLCSKRKELWKSLLIQMHWFFFKTYRAYPYG